MRVMLMRRADEETEASVLPSTELIEAMGRYHEELVRAGVLLAGEGLMASEHGARVYFDGNGGTTVVDGPFAEAKELVAGFTILEVRSMEEAVELVRKWPVEDAHGNARIEIRPVHEAEDFGEALTEETRAQIEQLRELDNSR